MPSPSQALSNGPGEVSPSNMAPPATNTRSFRINRSHFAYDIESLANNRVFHVKNSSLHHEKPDLVLYQGKDEQGPIVAACEFKTMSRDIHICLGDPNNAGDSDVRWEKLSKSSVIKTQYAWETQSTKEHSGIAGHSLMWKKTQSIAVEDPEPSESGSKNLKLVEGESDDALAVFTSTKSWASGGKLEIRVEFGEAFDLLVMLSCVAIFEKAFKNSIMASNASGTFAASSGGV